MRIIPNATQVFADVLARELTKAEDERDPAIVELEKKWRAGKLKLVDHVIYSNRTMSAATQVDFFKTDDAKAIGGVNLANAKLETDQYFVPMGIQILCGDLGAVSTPTLLGAEPYDDIFVAGGQLNSGELTVKYNNGEYLLNETALSEFVTAGSEGIKGFKPLANTFLFKPNLKVEAFIKTGFATAANLGVRFALWGAMTMPKA